MKKSLKRKLQDTYDWYERAVQYLKSQGQEPDQRIIDGKVLLKGLLKERRRAVFVGQFSAGKTHLVNRILGGKLLPEGLQETTAIPTLVRNGKSEALLVPDGNDGYSRATQEETEEFRNLKVGDVPRVMMRFIQNQRILIFESPISGKFSDDWEFVDLPGHSSTHQHILENNRRQLQEADLAIVTVNMKSGPGRDLVDFLKSSLSTHTQVALIGTYADLIPPNKRSQTILDHKKTLSRSLGRKIEISRCSTASGFCSSSWNEILGSASVDVASLPEKAIDQITFLLRVLRNARDSAEGTSERLSDSSTLRRLDAEYQEIVQELLHGIQQNAIDRVKKHNYGYHLNPVVVKSREQMAISKIKSLRDKSINSAASIVDDEEILAIVSAIEALSAHYLGLVCGIAGTCRGICWRYEIGVGDKVIAKSIALPLSRIFLNGEYEQEEYRRAGMSEEHKLHLDRFREFRTHFKKNNETTSFKRRLSSRLRESSNASNSDLASFITEGEKLRRRL